MFECIHTTERENKGEREREVLGQPTYNQVPIIKHHMHIKKSAWNKKNERKTEDSNVKSEIHLVWHKYAPLFCCVLVYYQSFCR